jgi:hypothetical protein
VVVKSDDLRGECVALTSQGVDTSRIDTDQLEPSDDADRKRAHDGGGGKRLT